jgi:hypothetical protein
MLQRVADIELSQMFSGYGNSTAYKEPAQGKKRITLVLTLRDYQFSFLHATAVYTLQAVAYGPDKKLLFDNSYTEEGSSQRGRMAASVYGTAPAIRHSSLDALKKIFVRLRVDLDNALQTLPPS